MAHSAGSGSLPQRPGSKTSGPSVNGHQSSKKRYENDDKIVKCLQRLCYCINGKVNDGNLKSMCKFAVQYLNDCPKVQAQKSVYDEKYYEDRIKRELKQLGLGSIEDVVMFDDNIRQIKEWNVLKNRPAVLQLLAGLANSVPDQPKPHVGDIIGEVKKLAADMENHPFLAAPLTTIMPIRTQSKSSATSSSSSAGLPEFMSLPALNGLTVAPSDDNRQVVSLREQRVTAFGGPTANASDTYIVPAGRRIPTNEPAVTEAMLVQDLIFSFQGINGTVLKYDPIVGGYNIDTKLPMARRLRHMTLKLAELSFLHNQVRDHCDSWSVKKCAGIVGQSLTAVMREELTEYYRLLANMQSQISLPASTELPSSHGLTLRGLVVWTADPYDRFLWLTTVLQACSGMRGGAIASCVHGYLQHGDMAVRDIVRRILAAVSKPIFRMLSRWILDGELDDPYGEFFIAGNNAITGARLWHEKYRVQESMVPSFISMAQAEKILATGKSINFLREVCNDHLELRGREALKQALETTSVEVLFMSDHHSELTEMIDTAYLETSKRVIDVLISQYRFLDHLQALRDFMLLGQGDFIRYLMELLEPELVKPGTELAAHNLTGTLETAVRATNAQFHTPDVVARLDVRLMDQTPGDRGWDLFTLDYHINGPIGTVFSPTTTTYLLLFQALWKAKRIEWILSRMWKQQVTASKTLRKIPELGPVLQQIHLLTSEMVHLVHQMQYYVLFEVIECSWEELAARVKEAESLDDIIRAHHYFLNKVQAGALLDPANSDLSIQLRAMYETILQFQLQVETLHIRAHKLLDLRTKRNELIEERGKKGKFGIDESQEKEYAAAETKFIDKEIPLARVQIKTLANSYQKCVRKLLLMLSSTQDVSLQLLSFRLDFNEHYKRSDSQLSASVTYQQRRLSTMGVHVK